MTKKKTTAPVEPVEEMTAKEEPQADAKEEKIYIVPLENLQHGKVFVTGQGGKYRLVPAMRVGEYSLVQVPEA